MFYKQENKLFFGGMGIGKYNRRIIEKEEIVQYNFGTPSFS